MIRWFVLTVVVASASGCMGLLVGDPHPYAYVMRMGSADAIGRWTSRQAEGRKIYDGLTGLCVHVYCTDNTAEAETATHWILVNMDRVEDRPASGVWPSSNGEYWTTTELVETVYQNVAADAFNHASQAALLLRMRPDEYHRQWLPVWEKSMSDLQEWRREFENRNKAGRRP